MKNSISLKEFNIINTMEVFSTKTSQVECLVTFDGWEAPSHKGLEILFESEGVTESIPLDTHFLGLRSLVGNHIRSTGHGLTFKMSRKGFINRVKGLITLYYSGRYLPTELKELEVYFQLKGQRLVVVVRKP